MRQPTEAHIAIFARFEAYLREHTGIDRFRCVLDVGGGPAGYGLLYRDIADAVYVCDLHDRTESYSDSDIRFITGDITARLPLADCTFDLVCSHSTFEHIDGVPAALSEVDRLLTVGGFAFITIRPMYFSSQGFHHRHDDNWRHLMDGNEPQMPDGHLGSFLNKLTYAEMLAAVGAIGWRIRDFTPKYHTDRTPPPELLARYSDVDLLGMEFFALFEKLRDRVPDEDRSSTKSR